MYKSKLKTVLTETADVVFDSAYEHVLHPMHDALYEKETLSCLQRTCRHTQQVARPKRVATSSMRHEVTDVAPIAELVKC